MSLRIVLIVAGVLALLFGAYFLFWTDQAIQSFELGASDVAGRLFSRNLGGALICLGIINLIALPTELNSAISPTRHRDGGGRGR
jgi:hypothetical protein